jgi:hypothetical protein
VPRLLRFQHTDGSFVILAAVLQLALYAIVSVAQCPVQVAKAEKASDWDEVFKQSGPGDGLEPAGQAGWTGGDSTFSVPLANGDSAFFFSDSYIGESPAVMGDGRVSVRSDGARVTQINCYPPFCSPPQSSFSARNSIVVLSRDRKRLTTYVGQKGDRGISSSFFAEPASGLNYWMGDQLALPDGKLLVFLHKFDAKLAFHGVSLALVDQKTFRIEKLKDIGLPSNEIHWGSSVLKQGRHLYIYGKGSVQGYKLPFVARVQATISFDKILDTSSWSVWDGKGWVKDLTKSAPIVAANDSISDEFTIRKFEIKGRPTFVMVGIDTTVPFVEWKDITIYSSCVPEGPFVGKQKVYSMPESGATAIESAKGPVKLSGALVVYNPHIHSQFSNRGRILISYNTNRSDPRDSIFIDGYRPRFIWLPITGLKAIGTDQDK